MSAALVAAEAGHFQHPPVTRVRPARATWLTFAASRALFVSEHTVQDHLKSVFDKTGARNRGTLLARINGR